MWDQKSYLQLIKEIYLQEMQFSSFQYYDYLFKLCGFSNLASELEKYNIFISLRIVTQYSHFFLLLAFYFSLFLENIIYL